MWGKASIFISILIVLSSCGSAKKAEKNISEGKYDQAFDIAYSALSQDKNKKSNQKLIPSLKEAYDKAYDRDIQNIKRLKKEKNPANLKKIYATYMAMDVRQDDVESLLPLYYDGKMVQFDTHDFTSDIAQSLKEYSDFLYNKGTQELSGSKMDARKAYKTFNDLEFVNPNYVDNLENLINQAKKKGSSFVLLKVQDKTPKSLDTKAFVDLTNINESNMQNQWVIYNAQQDPNTHYDYEATVNLDKIQITPEQVNTETIPQQARIKDGWEYVYDENGNVAKDSLGNDIKRDKIITVQAEVKMFQQRKAARIDGGIAIKNLNSNTQMAVTPLFGEAKFENIFAKYRGDQRAIEQKYVKALQNKEVPFPPDEEFIKYAIGDFKNKMLPILDQQPF